MFLKRKKIKNNIEIKIEPEKIILDNKPIIIQKVNGNDKDIELKKINNNKKIILRL